MQSQAKPTVIEQLIVLIILFALIALSAATNGCSTKGAEPARLLTEVNRPVYFEHGGIDRLGVLEYSPNGRCFQVRHDCRAVIARGDGYHSWQRRDCEVPFGYAHQHAHLFAGFFRETTHFGPRDTNGHGTYTMTIDKRLTNGGDHAGDQLCVRPANGIIE